MPRASSNSSCLTLSTKTWRARTIRSCYSGGTKTGVDGGGVGALVWTLHVNISHIGRFPTEGSGWRLQPFVYHTSHHFRLVLE